MPPFSVHFSVSVKKIRLFGDNLCILSVSPNEARCELKVLVSSGNDMHGFSLSPVGENISTFSCCRAPHEFVEGWGRRMGKKTPKLVYLFIGISVMSAVDTM